MWGVGCGLRWDRMGWDGIEGWRLGMRARGKWRGGLEWDGMAWHGIEGWQGEGRYRGR